MHTNFIIFNWIPASNLLQHCSWSSHMVSLAVFSGVSGHWDFGLVSKTEVSGGSGH